MLLPPLSDPLPSPQGRLPWEDELAEEYGFRPTEPPSVGQRTSSGFPAAGLLYATDLFEAVLSVLKEG